MARYHRQTAQRCPRCGEQRLRYDHGIYLCRDCTQFVPAEALPVTLADGTVLDGLARELAVEQVWGLIWRA